jgi:hypothetical protein
LNQPIKIVRKFGFILSQLALVYFRYWYDVKLIDGQPDHNDKTNGTLNIMTLADDDNEVMERVYCLNN